MGRGLDAKCNFLGNGIHISYTESLEVNFNGSCKKVAYRAKTVLLSIFE